MSNIVIGGTTYPDVNAIKIPLADDPSEYAVYSNKDSAMLEGNLSGTFENSEVTTLKAYAFFGMDQVTSVSFPKVKTAQGNYTFQNCKALESVNLPLLEKVVGGMFTGCNALVEAVLPKVVVCDIQSFNNCAALKKVDIGGPITNVSSTIAATAFANSTNFETLIIRSTLAILKLANDNVFNNTKIASGTGYVYVPNAMLASYTADSTWATYKNQLRAIEDYPDICG